MMYACIERGSLIPVRSAIATRRRAVSKDVPEPKTRSVVLLVLAMLTLWLYKVSLKNLVSWMLLKNVQKVT